MRKYGPDSTDNAQLHIAYSALSPYWSMVHNYVPTLDNSPANEWNSDAEKQMYIGERFYFSNGQDNAVYQFAYDDLAMEWKWSVFDEDMKIIVNGITGEPVLNTTREPLPWLPPKTWKQQVNDLLGDTITFSAGDFFWNGEWTDGPVDEADYRDGFYAYMNSRHDFVYRITSVGGPYSVIPHFEILGA